MIIDCHTHIWDSVEQLGKGARLWDARGRGGRWTTPPKAGPDDHLTATRPVDKAFVLAFKSRYLKAEVSNEYVAGYVRRHADRLIGFAGVDPSQPRQAIQDLRRAHDELGMQGVTVWPAAQDFHPASSAAMSVYAEANRLQMPVLFHQDVQASPSTKMEFARPFLLDEVAREFTDLKIIVSQLGCPWVDETIALLGKHPHVFADISGLLHHPWQAYTALISAYQSGVMDALLFGSNFPFTSAAACIESLYSINQFCHGTNLPTIPREQLRRVVERNTLELLGLEKRNAPAPRERDTTVIHTDD
jgi:predicted TIM-barrel fold metal-dependent hydrolase